MRISDWSSDVCSSDDVAVNRGVRLELGRDDTQRLDILAYRFRKAGDAADDLGDAVGGHIVRDRRTDVVLRNPHTDRKSVVKCKRVYARVVLVGLSLL